MGLTPEQHQAVDAYLAKHAGEDAPLVKALLTDGELSTGDPSATSPKGARGLMQLMPIAVKDIGLDPDTFPYDNPAENLKGGIAYVRKLREDYGFTNPLQIAAAYNAGPSAVKAAVAKGGIQFLPAETQAYVKRMHAALSQRVNAPEVSAPQDSPAVPETAPPPSQPTMPVMSDQQDPVDRAQLPTDSVYTPPVGAVAGQAGAPIPVGTPGAAPVGAAGTLARAPIRAATGLADLAAQGGAMLFGGPNATPADFGVGSATELGERVIGPAPNVRSAEGYLDAAGQGAAVGAATGLPAGPVGALTGAVGGAVTGVVSHATANFAERLGLPRIVGGVAGGVAVGAVTAAAKGGINLVKSVTSEAKATRRAMQELDDATAAVQTATTHRTNVLREAEDEAQAAKDAALLQRRQATIAAAQARGETVRQAESAAVRAAMARDEARKSVTAAVDDYLVKETSPVERAAMMQRITQDRRDAIHAHVSSKYDDFLQRADDSGTLVPTQEIVAEATQIVDDLVIAGIPREQAAAQAKAIMQVLGRPGISFTHAQALRSSLGAYTFKAKGPAKERFLRMQNEVDRAIVKALPDDAMRTEFTKLRAYRRAESVLFQNTFVKKMLADTEEGRLAAEAYTTRLLSGDWTPAKMTSLLTVKEAAGEGGQNILKDALLRQAMDDTKGDLGELARVLRSQDGLGQMSRELLSPAEFTRIAEVSDALKKAAREFDDVSAAVKPARAEAQRRFLTRKAEALETQAKQVAGARRTLLQQKRTQQDLVTAARLRERAAKLNVPAGAEHSSRSVLGVLGQVLWQRKAGLRMLLDPRQRATLVRAAKLSATSTKGQDMLRTLLISGAVGSDQQAGAPAPAATGVPAR